MYKNNSKVYDKRVQVHIIENVHTVDLLKILCLFIIRYLETSSQQSKQHNFFYQKFESHVNIIDILKISLRKYSDMLILRQICMEITTS